MYCITHEMQGFFESRDMNGEKCLWVSCPPPELEEDWELHLIPPTPAEIESLNLSAKELEMDFPMQKVKKVRRFRFLGYGNRIPCPDGIESYLEMPQDKFYWYTSPALTVGKVYESVSLDYDYAIGFFPEIMIVDDEGDVMNQELQFFEEVL